MSEIEPTAPTDPSAALAAAHLAALEEIRLICLKSARLMADDLEAACEPESGVDAHGKATLMQAVQRAARGVRQTIALEMRVVRDRNAQAEKDAARQAKEEQDRLQALEEEEDDYDDDDEEDDPAVQRGGLVKAQAALVAAREIERYTEHQDREKLFDDLHGLLNDDDDDDEFDGLTLDEAVAHFRQQMEVNEHWKPLTKAQAWLQYFEAVESERLEAAAQAP